VLLCWASQAACNQALSTLWGPHPAHLQHNLLHLLHTRMCLPIQVQARQELVERPALPWCCSSSQVRQLRSKGCCDRLNEINQTIQLLADAGLLERRLQHRLSKETSPVAFLPARLSVVARRSPIKAEQVLCLLRVVLGCQQLSTACSVGREWKCHRAGTIADRKVISAWTGTLFSIGGGRFIRPLTFSWVKLDYVLG
jgi:hypothetical protein